MVARIWPKLGDYYDNEAGREAWLEDLLHQKATDRSIEDIALGAIKYWASGDVHPSKDEAADCAACQVQPNGEYCDLHYWSEEDLTQVEIVQEKLVDLVAAALKSHYGWRQA